MKYSIVITGAIGAGKTTLVSKLEKHFSQTNVSYGIIPEYLDGMKNGPEMLNKWITGIITRDQFQEYIHESEDILNKKQEDKEIRIFERTPVEGAVIFTCEQPGFPKALEKASYLHKKYLIPDPRFTKPIIINADLSEEEVLKDVLSIIKNDIENDIKDRIIYLRISGETSNVRVNDRGRESEKKYSVDYLNTIISRYDQLFNVGTNIHE